MTGLNRDTTDKFYTVSSTVEICINLLKKNIKIEKNDLILEPSAGNGAFINEIKKLTKNFRFYDILPENQEIIKQDFLKFNEKFNQKVHILGNPPFGRQSTLAKKFIKKSCEIADTISFILPKSFKKESFKKTFPLNYWLKAEIDLPDNSFLFGGNPHSVKCIFQIWENC